MFIRCELTNIDGEVIIAYSISRYHNSSWKGRTTESSHQCLHYRIELADSEIRNILLLNQKYSQHEISTSDQITEKFT
jgi:hypothetical protein